MRALFITFMLLISTHTKVFGWDAQCSKLTRDQAIKSQLLIEKASKKVPDFLVIDQYCEHCLDEYVRPIVVDEVEIAHEGNVYGLYINGEKLDLAYIYVDNKNLAMQVNCKVIAVSKTIGR